MTLRIIGDSHGKNNRIGSFYYHSAAAIEKRTYIKILDDAWRKGVMFTLQIGDIGWRQDVAVMAGLTPYNHKVLYGNHDDYDNILPHSIGDYGIMEHGGIKFGFVRGEYSIDRWRRLDPAAVAKFGKTYWDQEEISYGEMLKALDFFTGKDIDLFISHGAPDFLIHHLVDEVRYAPSRTAKLLTEIHDAANIKKWVFGHYHRNQKLQSNKTDFLCLNELAYVDITDEYVFGSIF